MKNEIISIVKEVANKQNIKVDLSDADLDKPFKEMGILDSVYIFGIIVAIENKVGFKLDDAVLSKVRTLNELIQAFEDEKNRQQ